MRWATVAYCSALKNASDLDIRVASALLDSEAIPEERPKQGLKCPFSPDCDAARFATGRSSRRRQLNHRLMHGIPRLGTARARYWPVAADARVTRRDGFTKNQRLHKWRYQCLA